MASIIQTVVDGHLTLDAATNDNLTSKYNPMEILAIVECTIDSGNVYPSDYIQQAATLPPNVMNHAFRRLKKDEILDSMAYKALKRAKRQHAAHAINVLLRESLILPISTELVLQALASAEKNESLTLSESWTNEVTIDGEQSEQDEVKVKLSAVNGRNRNTIVSSITKNAKPVTSHCPRGCQLQLQWNDLGPDGSNQLEIVGDYETYRVGLGKYKLKHPCPTCKYAMNIKCEGRAELLCTKKASSSIRKAFVAVMWTGESGPSGLDKYVLQALVLGNRLQKLQIPKGSADLILLVTPEVLDAPSAWLLDLYWTVKKIRHVPVANILISKSHKRFKHVFTRLRIFDTCDEYDVIINLDLDTLLREDAGGIDELFRFETPAALMRGHRERDDGVQRAPGTYHDQEGKQKYGINAGVMVLNPSKARFEEMQDKLTQENHPEHIATTMPEQDFLTRFYMTQWFELHVRYNYQIRRTAKLHPRHPNKHKSGKAAFCLLLYFSLCWIVLEATETIPEQQHAVNEARKMPSILDFVCHQESIPSTRAELFKKLRFPFKKSHYGNEAGEV